MATLGTFGTNPISSTARALANSPALGEQSDVFEIPAKGDAEAEPLNVLLATAGFTGKAAGILISNPDGGNAIFIRTGTIGLAAGNTGKGIRIGAGASFYLSNYSTANLSIEHESVCYVLTYS
jgi:hypothetical protein